MENPFDNVQAFPLVPAVSEQSREIGELVNLFSPTLLSHYREEFHEEVSYSLIFSVRKVKFVCPAQAKYSHIRSLGETEVIPEDLLSAFKT